MAGDIFYTNPSPELLIISHQRNEIIRFYSTCVVSAIKSGWGLHEMTDEKGETALDRGKHQPRIELVLEDSMNTPAYHISMG